MTCINTNIMLKECRVLCCCSDTAAKVAVTGLQYTRGACRVVLQEFDACKKAGQSKQVCHAWLCMWVAVDGWHAWYHGLLQKQLAGVDGCDRLATTTIATSCMTHLLLLWDDGTSQDIPLIPGCARLRKVRGFFGLKALSKVLRPRRA
jgi:hypothetical protein